jgi:aspartate kinase
MKVYKFGGTSVGTPDRMKHVAELITADKEKKIIVLSAISGTTNALVEISELFQSGNINGSIARLEQLRATYNPFMQTLLSKTSSKERASKIVNQYFDEMHRLIHQPFYKQIPKIIIVNGELISTHLFQIYLNERYPSCTTLIPACEFMYLNESGEPNMELISAKLDSLLKQNIAYELLVTQGFICRNCSGGIDNLNRGGSDYSATIIGAALKAEEIQIWTDIDGMHNNDPRIVNNTKPIYNLSFEEAGELAYFGAKILHPNCIIPAQQFDIPVRIKNTLKPMAHGTLITSDQNPETVKAIAAKDGITAIKIKSSRMILAYGFLRKVFEVFEHYQTPIDMITTSEIAVSVTIDTPKFLDQIVKDLQKYGKVEVDRNQTIICIVGDMVGEHKGVSSDIFKALEDLPIRMISYGGSRNNISLLVKDNLKEKTLKALNKQLFNYN